MQLVEVGQEMVCLPKENTSLAFSSISVPTRRFLNQASFF